MRRIVPVLFSIFLLVACSPSEFVLSTEYPSIFPDYVGVTVPSSLADLNFEMSDGRRCKVSMTNAGDSMMVSVKAWAKGDRKGVEYKPFPIYLSNDHIDPYLAYRLIEPAYESWHDMGIYQRELSSYKESAIVTNEANGKGCMNCHTFGAGDPDRMVFHARGKGGGTVFVDGQDVKILNLADIDPGRQGTYTAWHPDGRYLVFSSNNTHQSFQILGSQPLEVYDTESDIIIMDLETETISLVFDTPELLETYPSWSDDGKTLYYCVADKVDNLAVNRSDVHYSLMSISFENGSFVGESRPVLDLDGLSISYPRVNGDYLLFTASSYGTFPIWHKEADLWLLDLRTGEASPAAVLNSDDADSFHSWSSEGRWLVFGSRRDDGRYTRLYISHFDGKGNFSKPFMLPQADPDFDKTRLKSYNAPVFVKGESPNRQKQVGELFK